MALPLRRPGFRYGMTTTRTLRTTPLRSEQLKEQFVHSAEPTPLPKPRPMSKVDAYLIHMSQKDMRRRNPQIPSSLFAALRKEAYGKTEGKLHRLKRQGKIRSVYIPKAKRKKKSAHKKVVKKLRPRN